MPAIIIFQTCKMNYPKQIILGEVPSKSNSFKIITFKKKGGGPGHSSIAKTDELKAYEKSFALQCNLYRNKCITGWFELYINVYFPDNRKDLDNALKASIDCMGQVGAFSNDRYCKKIVAEKHFDEKNPRIEFVIIPLQEQLF